jgi:hypothetical protein
LGTDFLPHDTCVGEGAGPIWDRTQEQLGSTDRGIVTSRAVLLKAIRQVQAGGPAPANHYNPDQNWTPSVWARSDVLLSRSIDWRRYWEDEVVRAELQTVTASAGVPT